MSDYWIVGRITGECGTPLAEYYLYEVIKTSGYVSEDIGSKSQFGMCSIFCDSCTKLDSVDDSYILAKLL